MTFSSLYHEGKRKKKGLLPTVCGNQFLQHIQKFACKFNIWLQPSGSRLKPLCVSTTRGLLHRTCNNPIPASLFTLPYFIFSRYNRKRNLIKGGLTMLVHHLLSFGEPDRLAVFDQGRSYTYLDLRTLVRQCRNALYAQGIRQQTRVAIFSRKTVHYIVAYLALASLGAIAVPINSQLSQREVGFILRDSESSLLLYTGNPFAWNALEATADLEGSIRQLPLDGYLDSPAPEAPSLSETFTDQEPFLIIYTSGTTGRPKGALLSHANVTCNARQFQEILRITPEDRVLAVLPLYHCFCLITALINPLLVGASIFLYDSVNLKDIVHFIRDQQLTVLYLVPSLCSLLVRRGQPEDLASVRYTVVGGTAMPLSLLQAFEARYHQPIIEGYGLSEASPVVSVNPPEKVKSGTIGLPLPEIQVKVVDPEGREMPQGSRGELLVKGPNVMLGYWHLPKATADALVDGWLHTGDVVVEDQDGYLRIVDRLKDMIISMGENIYPREIEELVYAYPGIDEAAVIGIPDKLRGQAGCCFYTVREGETVDPRALKKYLQQNLAIYKVPRVFRQLETMPHLATGKIAKKELK